MKVEFWSKINGGIQDGAIFNGYLFSFNPQGRCVVYETKKLEIQKNAEAEIFAQFDLDKKDLIVPHSNAVSFGNEYYDEKDEFPLLYTNIYNNYAKAEDDLKGVCLVYRLQRNENKFTTTLLQIIEIGFANDKELWLSLGEKTDVRPYGNFVVDADAGIFYAFTMRDNENSTRYFSFDLPKANQGELCEKFGVKKLVLNKSDIKDYFDCEYHRFVQGACCHKGKIYSVEGFSVESQNPPAIRIIDPKFKKQIFFDKFGDYGVEIEPEMIDFYDDICIYYDDDGNVYKLFDLI